MSKKITNEKEYRGYSINNGRKKDFTSYKKTLDQVVDITEYMVSAHSKCLFVRLDIRNEVDSDRILERKDMTRVVENVQRSLDRKYKGGNRPDMNVVWTTENEDNMPHYHLYVGVNGNAIQNGYTILEEMNEAVQKRLSTDNAGLVEFSSSNGRCGIRVDRQSNTLHKDIEKAIYAGSYLAKTNTKNKRPKGARVSSASRLPQNWRGTSRYQELFESRRKAECEGYEEDIDDPQVADTNENYTCMCPPIDEYIGTEEDM